MSILAAGQPHDRALDALLAGYAAGGLSAPLHALMAGHLAICPRNRAFVASLEAAYGSAMERLDPAPVSDRDARLAAILDGPEEPIACAPPASRAADPVLPGPVARYLGHGIADMPWRTLLPGVKEFKIKADDATATLFWIRPGRRMPHHTHEGSEVTLVLRGGFTDVSGHYLRGDVAVADQEVDHRPVADPDEDCICFAVTDAPLRLTGPVGRIVQRLFGH